MGISLNLTFNIACRDSPLLFRENVYIQICLLEVYLKNNKLKSVIIVTEWQEWDSGIKVGWCTLKISRYTCYTLVIRRILNYFGDKQHLLGCFWERRKQKCLLFWWKMVLVSKSIKLSHLNKSSQNNSAFRNVANVCCLRGKQAKNCRIKFCCVHATNVIIIKKLLRNYTFCTTNV